MSTPHLGHVSGLGKQALGRLVNTAGSFLSSLKRPSPQRSEKPQVWFSAAGLGCLRPGGAKEGEFRGAERGSGRKEGLPADASTGRAVPTTDGLRVLLS